MKQPTSIDVLIVGAGPAGLMLATWLSRLGVKTRIVDKRSTKIFTGQADGLQSRTLEVLQSFDLADQILKEANFLMEICFWNPDEKGQLNRTARIPDSIAGISRYSEVVLHQGRIERVLLDSMRSHGLDVERAVLPDQLDIDESQASNPDAYPVQVRLRHLTDDEATPAQFGPTANGLFRSAMFQDDAADAKPTGSAAPGSQEIVNCKFVVGCDGARSWVRKTIGYQLVGEPANYYWGVIDGVPITDFPDIRYRCAIHSESSGSVMVIPRENGLVRFYIQLGDLPPGQRIDRSEVTPEKLLMAARKIMSPFTLSVPKVEWYTCYEIGQRLCKNFSKLDRVFIAGDACHTHSPKAGQGMNTSMMDTYNLGWKLAHAVHKTAKLDILSTYETERQQVAEDLINFDHKFSRLFSGKPQKEVQDAAGIDLKEFKRVFERGMAFTSGTATDYQDSIITARASGSRQELATECPVGQRFKSHPVVCHSDARPWHIGDRMPSDGRWRILLFPGDIRKPALRKALDELAGYLDSPSGPIRRYTGKGQEIDSVIQLFTVIASPRVDIEPDAFPDILRPTFGEFKYRNHHQVYADDASHHQPHPQAYEKWGIDANVGAVLTVRPDGYVSLITALDDHTSIGSFFDRFMLAPAAGPIDANVGHGWKNGELPPSAQ